MPSPRPVTTTEVALTPGTATTRTTSSALPVASTVGEHRLQVHDGLARQVVTGREVGAVGRSHRADDEGVDGELGGGSGR